MYPICPVSGQAPVKHPRQLWHLVVHKIVNKGYVFIVVQTV